MSVTEAIKLLCKGSFSLNCTCEIQPIGEYQGCSCVYIQYTQVINYLEDSRIDHLVR